MHRTAFLALLALALLAAACRSAPSGAPEGAAEEQEVVVFAAASLQDAFTKLAESFRGAHPGVDVKMSFAGSQELRTQVEHGAVFDVFASADTVNADALRRANHLASLSTFAENEPVVVVAPGAASLVRVFADLPEVDRLVVGTPEVPIGRYTLQILERASAELGDDFRARVESKVASRELNVRQVLSKVVLGEAQAGIVYRSDAVTAKSPLRIVGIPAAFSVIARYPIAVAARPPHPKLAQAWVDHVRSQAGRAALTGAGFRVPEPRK